MGSKPLEGIRIVDLTRVVSGPFATMQLGDLGAEIIKIEEPKNGDDSRSFGPPFIGGESSYFLSVNRNKRSCAINLKSEKGRSLLLDIVRKSDVVIDNFRPGTMERLGLDYETLKSVNSKVIHCSITGFGETGIDANRPGYDLILQGEAGIMGITGEPDGSPMKVGTSIGDLVTGLYAVQGVLAALADRDKTGEGSTVNISMLDSLSSLLTFNAGIYFTTGKSPIRRGNEHPTIAPYETFKASDGWLNIGVANDKFWQLFCDSIGRLDLTEDQRFMTAPNRVENREELKAIMEDIIGEESRDYWIEKLNHVGVPCGAIRTIEEVCEAEQLVSRGMVTRVEHPTAGTVKNINSPIRLNDMHASDSTAPPLLGGDTSEVLSELLGMTATEVSDLEKEKVIRTS